MSRPLSPAMRTALMEVEILGYTPYQAAKRNGVQQSGISRQLNKPKAQSCPACGQKIKSNHSAPEAPQVEWGGQNEEYEMEENNVSSWKEEYSFHVKRTSGRVIVVCEIMAGDRFTGWYRLRECGENNTHRYRKSEILSMTETLRKRQNKTTD